MLILVTECCQSVIARPIEESYMQALIISYQFYGLVWRVNAIRILSLLHANMDIELVFSTLTYCIQ